VRVPATTPLVYFDRYRCALEEFAIFVTAAGEKVALILAKAVGDVENVALLLIGLLEDRRACRCWVVGGSSCCCRSLLLGLVSAL